MKKIITITFILVLGVMVLSGCTSNQQYGGDNIPQPPALPED